MRWVGALVGGALALAGGAIALNRCVSGAIADAGTVDAVGLQALKTGPRQVKLTGMTVDWEHRRYRVGAWGPLYSADPRVVTTVASVDDLVARRKELLGHYVRLDGTTPSKNFFYLTKKSVPDNRTLQQDTALYSPLEGTNGAGWIVSEVLTSKDDPRAQEFLARTTHVGIVRWVVDVYDGAMLATSYEKGGRRLPTDAVALDTELPVPAGSPMTTWAPLAGESPAGAKYDRWIIVDGTPAEPPATLAGIFDVTQDANLDLEIGRLRGHGMDPATRRVLWIGEPAAYRETHPDQQRVSYVGLVLLAIGIAVAGGGTVLARRA